MIGCIILIPEEIICAGAIINPVYWVNAIYVPKVMFFPQKKYAYNAVMLNEAATFIKVIISTLNA